MERRRAAHGHLQLLCASTASLPFCPVVLKHFCAWADAPVMAQYHRSNLPREVVEAMPAKRQTLFRGVWGHGGDPFENVYYDPETNFAW